MPTANPESKIIHFVPGERCNLDDARDDPGPTPIKVSMREAWNMILKEGYVPCEAEDEED